MAEIRTSHDACPVADRPDRRKYSLTDLDDNVGRLPTNIHVLWYGRPMPIPTGLYREAKPLIWRKEGGFVTGAEGWEPLRRPDGSPDTDAMFVEFDAARDEEFIQQYLACEPGVAMPHLVETVNAGRLQGHLTARGHSVDALVEAQRRAIFSCLWGLDPRKVAQSTREFLDTAVDPVAPRGNSVEDLVEHYLWLCRPWHLPVNNPDIRMLLSLGDASLGIAELKGRGVMRAVRLAVDMDRRLPGTIGVPSLGFSDDAPENLAEVVRYVRSQGPLPVNLSTFCTLDGVVRPHDKILSDTESALLDWHPSGSPSATNPSA